MNLLEIARIIGSDYHGDNSSINSITTDSRTVQKGDLFFAIRGDKFDGHDFIAQVTKNGATAAIVENSHQRADIPLLVVSDTRKALGQLAAYHRQQIGCQVVAVTGSCGKTTTRALLENVFMQHAPTLASQKSYNNNIGVPLTLLGLTKEHRYLIAELGANHHGEIAYLTQIVEPDVAIITNTASAHLEGFGSLDGVARAKGEIFQGLKPGGTAVLNQDDHYVDFWRQLVAPHRIITFGVERQADVMASNINCDEFSRPSFQLYLFGKQVQIHLQIMGEHNVRNALAAAAAGYALGLSIEEIKRGLDNTQAVQRRLIEKKGYAGASIIDDSYNANPVSVAAAMAVLSKRTGHKILVLGDMLEMGPTSSQLHTELGEKALQYGIDSLYCYGKETRHTASKFGKNAFYFERQEDLIKSLKNNLSKDMTVLVKGSLGMEMAKVTAALLEQS